MKRFRWQLIIIFIAGIIVGILLLGEQPAEVSYFEPEPVQGGIYTEALIGSLQRLNPVLDYYNPVDREVSKLIFSGLLKMDDRGVPQLDLAESRGISRDGTVYNFTLKADTFWHDGDALTTDDILFTIELLREGGDVVPEDIRNFWQEIEVAALSDRTIQFRLPEPFAPFQDYLTFGILPAHLLADQSFEQIIDNQFNLQPIGSGPYKFDRLIVENEEITGVVLSAFEDYYADRPFIDQIVFRYYPDSAAAFQAYQDGMVQGIGSVSQEILPEVLKQQDLNLYTARKPEMGIIFLNLNNPEVPFFQEASIRKALLQGINRQWIIDRVLSGQGVIANGVILPNTWAYYDGLEQFDYDVETAKLALKEAGYLVGSEGEPVRENEGVRFEFELIYPDDDIHQAIAESIQNDWSKLEISVILTALPYDELINKRLQTRTYEAALIDLNLSRTPDPDPYPFWDQAQATGGQNYSQWDDRVASEYLEQARVTWDLSERARLYRNFQVIFQNEMPSLPLYYTIYNYAVSQNVLGVRVGPIFDSSDRFLTVTDWYLLALTSPAQNTGE
jgi:peptide/nickel transport system substrate-binding protein